MSSNSQHSHATNATAPATVAAHSHTRHTHATNATDPTRTKTLRKRFSGEAYRRLRDLKGDIREAVETNDAFRLGDALSRNPRAVGQREQTANAFRRALAVQQPPGPGAFDFPTDDAKVQAFREWLDDRVADGVLEVTESPLPRRDSPTSAWANTYIRQAYSKGVQHAEQAAQQQGLAAPTEQLDNVFRAPQHADAAGLIYTRTYRELEGVTSEMGRQMSRELTEGITQGWNPRKTARSMNEVVDDIGITRSRMVARTESIRSFNEAALNRYSDLGIDSVSAEVEFLTAQDSDVCTRCASLSGETRSLKDARGVIPIHPNCRCTWVPADT